MAMRAWRPNYVAVTVDSGEEDMEAFGPFSSRQAADRFVEQYEEEGCRPAYPLAVVEIYPVREGLRIVREEAAINRREDAR